MFVVRKIHILKNTQMIKMKKKLMFEFDIPAKLMPIVSNISIW